MDEWPPFLDILESDPAKATDQFARKVITLIDTTPPRYLQRWINTSCGESREEFINELIFRCCTRNFEKLRKYKRVKGRPFDNWLLKVANNIIVDDMRKNIWKRIIKTLTTKDYLTYSQSDDLLIPPSLSNAILQCMQRMNLYRQQLIYYRYVEKMPPREIADTLDLQKNEDSRKKISNDASYALSLIQDCVHTKMPNARKIFQLWLNNFQDAI